jgi:hypothetical protein
VPEATVIGFFNVTPQKSTAKFILTASL